MEYIRTEENPITRLMQYVSTLKPKVDVLIRAQETTESFSKPVKRVRKHSPAEEERLSCELARKNIPLLDIANEIGIHRTTVAKYLALNGIPFDHLSKEYRNKQPASRELGLKMQDMVRRGVGIASAARKLNATPRLAYAALAMVGGAK